MGIEETASRLLKERLARLGDRTEKIEADLRKPGNRDWTERATELENDAVLELLNEAELSEMRDIRNALARIESGTYGVCERCGDSIGERRLEAVPIASVCIDCAE